MLLSYLNLFIPLLLICSSLKFYGYAYSFIFFLPWSIRNFKKVFIDIKNQTFSNKLVTIYLGFLLIQSFLGGLFVKDIRILFFWIPFFFICFYAYYLNIYNLKNNTFYRKNFLEIIFLSSLTYFFLYLLFNIFSLLYYKNTYQIQDFLWVGSSTAFSISAYLLTVIYIKLKEINYRIFSKYNFAFIFLIFMCELNDSRLGKLYIFTFTIFLLIEISLKKKFLNLVLFSLIIIISYSTSSYISTNLKNNALEKLREVKGITIKPHIQKTLVKDFEKSFFSIFSTRDIFNENKKLDGDNVRVLEVLVTKEKFVNSSLKEKFLGTGWYTSRITINNVRNIFIDKYKSRLSRPESFQKSSVTQLQGFNAIILDTGLVGIILTIVLYFLCIKNFLISKLSITHKAFYIAMLLINFFCLFIGYPLINILYILFYLPEGLLNSFQYQLKSKDI